MLSWLAEPSANLGSSLNKWALSFVYLLEALGDDADDIVEFLASVTGKGATLLDPLEWSFRSIWATRYHFRFNHRA